MALSAAGRQNACPFFQAGAILYNIYGMELKDKSAIITGASRGIGKAVALELARQGCNMVITSRNIDELNRLAIEVEKNGTKAFPIALDLSEKESIDKLIDHTLEKFGDIDILINNAGIAVVKPFHETSLEEWEQHINLNLTTVFLLCQKAFEQMKKNRKGYIINVSSSVAFGVPKLLSAYGASKTGLIGLTQALYETAKEYNIKVSCVYPGITDTKMVRDINPEHSTPQEWMKPEDIAYCILFLLKSSGRMIIKDLVPWSTGYDQI